ncbi:MAG: acyl-CoA reductase [Bacteroidales bacterium]|nr:acyl-CoA reductase [Bacteroidales bacterium]
MQFYKMAHSIENSINTLHLFGDQLRMFVQASGNQGGSVTDSPGSQSEMLRNSVVQAEIENPWFIKDFQLKNLETWGRLLNKETLSVWLGRYPANSFSPANPKRVGLILAGNVPLVGLHDILCVLLSGNIAVTKLSSKDRAVYPVLKKMLGDLDPSFAERWLLIEGETLKNFDAVIATGSGNSSRYFNYYFGKFPNIIRKNRNSVAVLTGKETEDQLRKLADDIFLFFGLGCRNVSKLYVPENFDPDTLYRNVMDYAFFSNHNKYANNYEYQRAVLLVNSEKFLDNGFLILKEDPVIASPVGCLYYEKYSTLERLSQKLEKERHQIQCLVTIAENFPEKTEPGKAQFPELFDYADGIDTLNFLLNLSKN